MVDKNHEGARRIEERLGYRFGDPALLELALTHASFKNEAPAPMEDNERLEFLGDAVLELVVSDRLFRENPGTPEGRLTQLRARLVNAHNLAAMAGDIRLGETLRLGRGEDQTGGRERRSVLADGLEALIGAVYLDGGFEVARGVIDTLFRDQLARAADQPAKDPKSRLQEWAQGHHRLTPSYRIVHSSGPEHDTSFEAEVSVGAVLAARGCGSSKKDAYRRAAVAALASLALDDDVSER